MTVTDLELGSFSDEPPWLVDPDEMRWRRAVPGLRAEIADELPRLTRATKVPPGVRVLRTTALLGGALAGWYFGARRRGAPESTAVLSRRLRLAAERLGPTYIKLGQIISAGDGIFPEELVAEFKRCRDQVPPEPFAVVRQVVEEDLGRPLEEVFARFRPEPLAAASIAQVHRATLCSGEDVVVKVQRPSVGQLVLKDLRVMAWLAPFTVGRIPIAALANPPALVELFAETITEELDFRIEAQNMLDVAQSLADLGQRDYVVPRPHPELVTPRVLVMERLEGFKFDDVTGMRDAGVDTEAVIRTGMIGFMEGAMIHGIFHGDLHGGNLFVLPDGRTALLDFGIVGRLTEPRRLAFLRLLMTATANDVHGQLAALRDLGALPPDTDLDAVIADLGLDKPIVDPTTMDADELVARDPADDQGPAGDRRTDAQGADAVHQEPGVLRWRHRHPRPRPRHPRRDRERVDALRHHARRPARRRAGDGPHELRARPRGRAGQLRVRAGRGRHHLPRAPGSARDHPRPAEEAATPVRLVVARCAVDYEGRLSAHLPMATRLIMVKRDGCVAIHADGGAYKPLNWMVAPNRIVEADGLWTVTNPKGERLVITIEEILSDSLHDLGTDPGLQKDGVEAHLQELLAAACHELEIGMVLVRREHRTEIGPVDLLCRDAEGRAVAVEIKRRGEIDGVEQLARYLEFMERDPMLRPVRGMFVAQIIKPQAKALAAERGITCVEVDYDKLRGIERPQTSLF